MKTTDWIIIIATAAYTYLFYEQLPGINFVIFNIVLIGGLIIREPFVMANSKWLLASFASLFTAACIAIYGNTLSVIANITSLSLLSALSFRPSTSVVIALLNAMYSYLSAPVFMVMRWFQKKDTVRPRSSAAARLATIVFPILVVLLFFFIYRAGNPQFKQMTDLIDIDISWPLVRFIFLGAIIISGYYFHQAIDFLDEADHKATSQLYQDQLQEYEHTNVGRNIDLPTQIRSGVVMFSLLNILLLAVNGTDAVFLWFKSAPLSLAVDYSQAIHDSINTLIFSIVLAIGLILFFFRGHINFEKHNGLIKALVFLWIIQNVILACSSSYRNLQYVSMHGLTYKRIGVYVYLLLTLSGLITTYIKVAQQKSNWYLFRTNGWSFFFVLVFACAINWDVWITSYNLNHKDTIRLDYAYLNTLGYSNIPVVGEFMAEADKENVQNLFKWRVKHFISDMEDSGWQSWSSEREKVWHYLQEKNWDTEEKFNENYGY